MEERKEILLGEIKIKTRKNLENGKYELFVHFEDPNGIDGFCFIKELKIGNTNYVPFTGKEESDN